MLLLFELHIVAVVHFRAMAILVSVASTNLSNYNPFYGKHFP